VALFRADQLKEAIEMLNSSLAEQPPEQQPFDLYFLSMCHARQGDQTEAHRCFDRAETLVRNDEAQLPPKWRAELVQFSEESRMLLDPSVSAASSER